MATFYYDPVYDACEPCLSSTAGNQCVFMPPADPRNQDWIIDDSDVFPDSDDFPAIACGANEKFDKFMAKCRPLCPGEGAGGQEFVYDGDTHFGGKCECPDAKHMTFDASTNTCVPTTASTSALGLSPGDPFSACNLDARQYMNCYFPDRNTCLDMVRNAALDDDGGINVQGRILSQQALSAACPYMMCTTSHSDVHQGQFMAPRKDCVCLTKSLGSHIHASGKRKARKLKK